MTAWAMNIDDLPEDEFEELDAEPSVAKRWLPWIAGVTAAVAVLGMAWLALSLSGADLIREVHIEGVFERVEASEVESAIQPFLASSLAGFDLDGAKQAIERIPWIARARVERVWPDRLRLRVWERQPFAVWGETQLLDTDAQRFAPGDSLPEGLPRLSGPEGSEAVVAETFRQLSAQLVDTEFRLLGLTRDARGEWSARTTGGIELRFGRGDSAQAMSMLMGPAQQALRDRMAEVAYVDLRYTNGFSVGWRLPESAKPGETGE